MRIYVSGTIVYLGWQSIPAACVSFYNGCSGHSLAQMKKSDSVRRDVLRDVCAALSPQV